MVNEWIKELHQHPEIGGVGMAMLLSVLRVMYDKKKGKVPRVIFESTTCGALAFSINAGVAAFGLPSDWFVFVGGAVGYFGATTVREIALKLINKKLN